MSILYPRTPPHLLSPNVYRLSSIIYLLYWSIYISCVRTVRPADVRLENAEHREQGREVVRDDDERQQGHVDEVVAIPRLSTAHEMTSLRTHIHPVKRLIEPR